ncbi:SRPBCC family protein [Candidatus Binatus sp.]|uniref:SRPBCC family protein n=1 Tax=Candidatus Binatus sp. TaxID=2811406 RepID=UPI003C794713
MTSGSDDLSVRSANSALPRPQPPGERWFSRVGRLFPRNVATDVVTTSVRFHASPETLWQRILTYEDVPASPPLLLRVLLPHPVRTEGDKSCVGASIQCTYKGGDMVKHITVVEPPHLMQFEVTQQRLGIEGCIMTLGGSYEIRSCGDQTEVVLTTNYRGYLRPRYLWRPLERFLAHQLHRHILDGIRASLPRPGLSTTSATAQR